MTIHTTVELYTPEDKEAFAKFLEASAAADRARPKDANYLGGLGGIIRSAEESMWQNQADAASEAVANDQTVETADLPAEETKPTRQRGQPSPGKQRRTKAEIAEDEAADNADKAATVANISSAPEDRQDPENPDPVDDEATAEADAADEAAETASAKSGDAPTHDDIRGILGKYRDVYGMDAAMEDGPVVLQEVCGEGVVKISDVPDDKIAAVLDAIKKVGNDNRFDRKQVAA